MPGLVDSSVKKRKRTDAAAVAKPSSKSKKLKAVKNADDGKFVAANLVEMEDPSVRSETCLWDAELQGEISNQLPISSLI